HHGSELVVNQHDAIDPARQKRVGRRLRDRLRILEPQLLEDADAVEQHGEAAAREEVASFAADEAERHRLPALEDEGAARLDHVRVEAAGEPLVAAHEDYERLAVRPDLSG